MTVTADILRDGLREMLWVHPRVAEFTGGHATYAERYVCDNGEAIAHESHGERQQKLWVRRDALRLRSLDDIRHDVRPAAERKPRSGVNSNILSLPNFDRSDLVAFYPRDLWQAARILREVAGDGANSEGDTG